MYLISSADLTAPRCWVSPGGQPEFACLFHCLILVALSSLGSYWRVEGSPLDRPIFVSAWIERSNGVLSVRGCGIEGVRCVGAKYWLTCFAIRAASAVLLDTINSKYHVSPSQHLVSHLPSPTNSDYTIQCKYPNLVPISSVSIKTLKFASSIRCQFPTFTNFMMIRPHLDPRYHVAGVSFKHPGLIWDTISQVRRLRLAWWKSAYCLFRFFVCYFCAVKQSGN